MSYFIFIKEFFYLIYSLIVFRYSNYIKFQLSEIFF